MMNDTILCKIRKSGENYEGTVTIPGLKPTKLMKAKGESTLYANRYGVTTAAKALAERFGLSLEVDDPTTNTSAKGRKISKSTTTPEVF